MKLVLSGPDQGYEESDTSSLFSSPSPQLRQRAASPASAILPVETQHASLRRKKVPEKTEPVRQTMLEKSQSLQAELAQQQQQQRPVSLVLASQADGTVVTHTNANSLHRQVSCWLSVIIKI